MEGALEGVGRRLDPLLRRQLTFLASGREVEPDAKLRELGLNSMNAINLLLEIEMEFGVVVPDELLVAETFETRATLERVIVSLLGVADNP